MLEKSEIDLILGQDTRKDELENYQNWLTAHNTNPEEAYNYRMYLGKLFRTNAVYDITLNEVWRLVSAIRCSKYSKSYQRHLLTALELYLEFKSIRNEQGCLIKFEKPRPSKRNPKYLTHDQMVAFVHGARDHREVAMAMLFLTTGIRLSELRNLDICDIDLVNATIKVRHGKGDKDREVPLSDQCVSVLKVYCSSYNLNGASASEPLFRSERGNRWSEHAIQAAVMRIGENAGLKARVTPHMLRHSFATHQIQNGCDIYSLKELLGHADIQVTQVYLHVNSSQKRQAYERGVPRF